MILLYVAGVMAGLASLEAFVSDLLGKYQSAAAWRIRCAVFCLFVWLFVIGLVIVWAQG